MRLSRLLTSARGSSISVRHLYTSSAEIPYIGCNVYISEGHDERIINKWKEVASATPGAYLVNTFVDKPYNRSSFTLVSKAPELLVSVAVRLASEALNCLDLRQHAATHPRLGVADHISCHPLNDAASLADAAAVAKAIAVQLSRGPHQLPVYLYGGASEHGARLADIRRQLGYFKDGGNSKWQGALGSVDLSHCPPDMGPQQAQLQHGIMTVGAVPWIVNFNIPLNTGNLAVARQLARAVSERGGGLKHVEAMALQHSGVIEIACNLLDYKTSGPEQVQAAVQAAAAQHGISLGQAYCIGKLPEQMIALADGGHTEEQMQ